MKKILIVSDSHRYDENIKKTIKAVGHLDYFIHLGDSEGCTDKYEDWLAPTVKKYMVRGNNDFSHLPDVKDEHIAKIGRYTALLTHGHIYNVSLDLGMLADEARAMGADIAMFGHKHRPCIERRDGITLINPGSISYPRQDGRHPSYMLMEIDDGGEAHYTINYL